MFSSPHSSITGPFLFVGLIVPGEQSQLLWGILISFCRTSEGRTNRSRERRNRNYFADGGSFTCSFSLPLPLTRKVQLISVCGKARSPFLLQCTGSPALVLHTGCLLSRAAVMHILNTLSSKCISVQFDGGTCETQRWIRCSTCINIHVHKKSCVFGGDLVGWMDAPPKRRDPLWPRRKDNFGRTIYSHE